MKVSKSRCSKLVFHATLASALCLSVAHSEDYSWGGATPGDWSNAANWSPAGGPPDAAGDGAFFNNGSALRQVSLDGDFQVGDLRVGFSDTVGAQGNVRLNASGPSSTILVDDGNDNGQFVVGSAVVSGVAGLGQLTLSNNISLSTVGGGAYIAGTNPALRDAGNQNQGRLIGDLTLESGSSLSIGTAAAPSQFFVGVAILDNSTSRGINGTVIANSGSTVDIRSTDLIVGSNATRRLVTTPAEIGRFGTLDLRDGSVGTFEVQDNFIIGRASYAYLFDLFNQNAGSYGDAHLANMAGSVGGDLWVGDIYFDESNPVLSSSGQLTLDNATLSITGDVDIWDTGIVEVTLNGAASGLVLSASSAIDLVPDDGYQIVFNDLDGYAGIYYGLAWGGDKVASLEALVNDGKISWVNNADGFVDIFYDSNSDFSYIAVIPEPHTIFFLLVPLAWLLVRNRRR